MQASSVISLSPSFNSYSNSRLTEIAARVADEFVSEGFHDEFHFEREGENPGFLDRERGNSVNPDEDDGEFEFAFVKRGSELPSPVSADDIFCNGQIRPVYPVSNRSLLPERNGFSNGDERENDAAPAVRLPLRKLFIEERETTMTMSSSSSEADELEGVPEETYCVWQPKASTAATAEKGRCKKSSSTGSNSKRWKFKDLLHRSQSDGGKERFLFLSPSSSLKRKENEERVKTPGGAGKLKSAVAAAASPPYKDGGEKRRTYLPYKQDLVGLFSSVNGLSKNFQPF